MHTEIQLTLAEPDDGKRAARLEGHADVAAALRRVLDPLDLNHLSLEGLLEAVANLKAARARAREYGLQIESAIDLAALKPGTLLIVKAEDYESETISKLKERILKLAPGAEGKIGLLVMRPEDSVEVRQVSAESVVVIKTDDSLSQEQIDKIRVRMGVKAVISLDLNDDFEVLSA
jgi:hypothetical protein